MTYTAEILPITHTGEILQSLMTHTAITLTLKVTLQSETSANITKERFRDE